MKLSSHQTGQLEEIARGNPQWPQAFYGMSHVFDVEEGDILFGRCTFDSTHKNKTTYIGNYECDHLLVDQKIIRRLLQVERPVTKCATFIWYCEMLFNSVDRILMM